MNLNPFISTHHGWEEYGVRGIHEVLVVANRSKGRLASKKSRIYVNISTYVLTPYINMDRVIHIRVEPSFDDVRPTHDDH